MSTMRELRGSIRRKSCCKVRRATSAIAPAISTPVAPPPTITKVRRRARSAASSTTSARSKASRNRRLISVASAMCLRPGANGSQSSRPK